MAPGRPRLKSPQEYRAEAERVRTLADQISRFELRLALIAVAELYEKLAVQTQTLALQRAGDRHASALFVKSAPLGTI